MYQFWKCIDMAIVTMHPYLVLWYLICNYIVEREVSMR